MVTALLKLILAKEDGIRDDIASLLLATVQYSGKQYLGVCRPLGHLSVYWRPTHPQHFNLHPVNPPFAKNSALRQLDFSYHTLKYCFIVQLAKS
jgi:hypothetical protein